MTSLSAIPEAQIINIVGDKTALGPLRRDLLPLYRKWVNDWDVARTLSVALAPITEDAEAEWFESTRQANGIHFTIYQRSPLRPIGNTALRNINFAHGVAEFGIMIGEKDTWGKGHGTETTRLMLDYAFTVLGLHNVLLQALSYNERGLRAYRSAGFKEIGRRRQAHRLGGVPHDVVYMDCLSSDFDPGSLRRLLPK